MPASYQIGQEVRIRPVKETGPSLRNGEISPYALKNGVVANYYGITSPAGAVFYLYTVRVDGINKEVVLYEDELTSASKPAHSKRKN
jgi:hypothetical protein